MEPRQEGISGGVERVPVSTAEYGLNLPETSLEKRGERGIEQQPEVGASHAEASQIAMPALPTPVITTQPTTAIASDDAIPSVAADDDLIEKEWVDKAKKIIAETRDDPYKREKEISKLQIEYIRKRYGREIGDSGEA